MATNETIEELNSEYNDFVKEYSDDKSNDGDSFNKEIMKLYEEHKKNEHKTVTNRPISSYNHTGAGPVGPGSKSNTGTQNSPAQSSSQKQKPHSATTKYQPASNNPPVKNKSYHQLIVELNDFFKTNKITKEQFYEGGKNIFVSIDDFKQMLMGVHCTLPFLHVHTIFYGDNNPQKEDFISLSTLMKHFIFYPSNEYEGNLSYSYSNVSERDQASQNQSQSQNQNQYQSQSQSQSQLSTSKAMKGQIDRLYEIKYLNQEFSQFNKDIKDILRGDSKNNLGNSYYSSSSVTTKTFQNQRSRVQSGKPKVVRYSIESNSRPITANNTIENYAQKKEEEDSIESEQNKRKVHYKANQAVRQYKMEEEEKVRQRDLDILQTKKDFVKDCFVKCEECNKFCEKLGKKKRYSIQYFDCLPPPKGRKAEADDVVMETKDGVQKVRCLVETEGEPDKIISLYGLVVEWRLISRSLERKDQEQEDREKLIAREQEDKDKENLNKLIQEREKEKNDRLKEVKDVLIETVRLKMKLKNQLDNLQQKVKIDENIVIENLIKVGFDIPPKEKPESDEEENNKALREIKKSLRKRK